MAFRPSRNISGGESFPEPARAKVVWDVKRQIQDSMKQAALGWYSGEIAHGGHRYPYRIEVTHLDLGVLRLDVTFDEDHINREEIEK